MVRIKAGVSLDQCDRHVFSIIAMAETVWMAYGADALWVTAANEPGHLTGPRGFHRLPNGTCQAVDLRVHNLPNDETRQKVVKRLGQILGPQYDVLHESVGSENEHVHVQWDPT